MWTRTTLGTIKSVEIATNFCSAILDIAKEENEEAADDPVPVVTTKVLDVHKFLGHVLKFLNQIPNKT